MMKTSTTKAVALEIKGVTADVQSTIQNRTRRAN